MCLQVWGFTSLPHTHTDLHVLHACATIMLNFSIERNEENTNYGALDLLKSECALIAMLYWYFSVISFCTLNKIVPWFQHVVSYHIVGPIHSAYSKWWMHNTGCNIYIQMCKSHYALLHIFIRIALYKNMSTTLCHMKQYSVNSLSKKKISTDYSYPVTMLHENVCQKAEPHT